MQGPCRPPGPSPRKDGRGPGCQAVHFAQRAARPLAAPALPRGGMAVHEPIHGGAGHRPADDVAVAGVAAAGGHVLRLHHEAGSSVLRVADRARPEIGDLRLRLHGAFEQGVQVGLHRGVRLGGAVRLRVQADDGQAALQAPRDRPQTRAPAAPGRRRDRTAPGAGRARASVSPGRGGYGFFSGRPGSRTVTWWGSRRRSPRKAGWFWVS